MWMTSAPLSHPRPCRKSIRRSLSTPRKTCTTATSSEAKMDRRRETLRRRTGFLIRMFRLQKHGTVRLIVGFGKEFQPTCFDTLGGTYRFNWHLEDDYWNDNPASVEDPVYNLGLKKESWVPDTGRFIMMHEYAAFPWNIDGMILVTSWHGRSNRGQLFDPRTLKGDRDKR